MSTPVRPPGGPSSPTVGGIDASAEVAPTKPSATTEVARATRLETPDAAPPAGSTESVITRLQAGELTREQAIDALVGQALERHGGSRLPVAQRGELAGVLRDALLHDPALGRLLG